MCNASGVYSMEKKKCECRGSWSGDHCTVINHECFIGSEPECKLSLYVNKKIKQTRKKEGKKRERKRKKEKNSQLIFFEVVVRKEKNIFRIIHIFCYSSITTTLSFIFFLLFLFSLSLPFFVFLSLLVFSLFLPFPSSFVFFVFLCRS